MKMNEDVDNSSFNLAPSHAGSIHKKAERERRVVKERKKKRKDFSFISLRDRRVRVNSVWSLTIS